MKESERLGSDHSILAIMDPGRSKRLFTLEKVFMNNVSLNKALR